MAAKSLRQRYEFGLERIFSKNSDIIKGTKYIIELERACLEASPLGNETYEALI